jgi:membrane dipeptidase
MKSFSQITKEEEEEALRIHKDAIVVDGLADPVRTRGQFERMIQGGITAANWTTVRLDHDFKEAVRDIAAEWYPLLEKNRDKITLISTATDILEAKKENKLGIILGMQDPRPIEDIPSVWVLHKLGVRVIQLTYNERSLLGDGATVKKDSGLSSLGERVVDELNRLGILIDLSHCGKRTGIEAAERSRQPVIFSHANAQALCKSPRNKTDEELKLIAKKGGVVGASAWGPCIWSKENQEPTIDDYLNQIDYMISVVGVDHVGIGLDIDEARYAGEEGREETEAYKAKYPEVVLPWLTPETRAKDLTVYAQVPNITKGLVGRGYSEQDIRKILGGNFLRVFQKVFKN